MTSVLSTMLICLGGNGKKKWSIKLGLEPRTFANSSKPESNALPLRHPTSVVRGGPSSLHVASW